MRRPVVLAPPLLLLAAAAFAGPDVEQIAGFVRVTDEVAIAAQPEPAQLAAVAEAGFRTLINLREPTEEYGAPAEAAAAEAAGLRYFVIPVSRTRPSPEAVEKFLRVTDDAEIRPVLIHCGTANRAGALWMIRRVLRDGWSLERAEEEASRIGLTSPVLREFARAYIAEHARPASE